jgi:thiol-disulfide isomerase/thioredoxin
MKKFSKLVLFVFLLLVLSRGEAQEIRKWKLHDLISAIQHADKPTIFNFWATFCKPCVAEIPYFQEVTKKYDSAGVQLILVNLDLPEAYPKIKAFAAKRKFTAPIVFLDETNADLFCPAVDKEWSGVIPASLFINNKTGYRKFFEDQLKKTQLENEIRAMVGMIVK